MSRRTPQPPRKRPGAAGVGEDLEPFEAHPGPILHHLDRRVAHDALREMDRRVDAVVVRRRAPADHLVVAQGEELAGVGVDADHHEPRHVATRRSRQAIRHADGERLVDQLEGDDPRPQRERRRRVDGVEQRARLRPHLERHGRAGVGGLVRRRQCLEHDLAHRDRGPEGHVDGAGGGGGGAGEVDGEGAVAVGDGDLHAHRVGGDAVVVEPVDRRPRTLRQRQQRRARRPLGVRQDLLDGPGHSVAAELGDDLDQAALTGAQTGDLGVHVTDDQLGHARC